MQVWSNSHLSGASGKRTADWVDNSAAEIGIVTLMNPSCNAGSSMVNSSVLINSVDPNFAGMAYSSSQNSVPFFGVTSATPKVFVPTQSSSSVVPCFMAFVPSCFKSSAGYYPYSSNNAINNVFSQSASFNRSSMSVKTAAASKCCFKLRNGCICFQ